jgi:hypothetical protein
MDADRFDSLARSLALRGSRRSALKALFVAFTGGLSTGLRRPRAGATQLHGTAEPKSCSSDDVCGPCGACVQGVCISRCLLDCLRCDSATGTCVSTCKTCQICTPAGREAGGCIDPCASCQRCNEQTSACEDACEPCTVCDARGSRGGGCILLCPSACQHCDPRTNASIDD